MTDDRNPSNPVDPWLACAPRVRAPVRRVRLDRASLPISGRRRLEALRRRAERADSARLPVPRVPGRSAPLRLAAPYCREDDVVIQCPLEAPCRLGDLEWEDDVIAQWVSMTYPDGATFVQIADAYGVTKQAVEAVFGAAVLWLQIQEGIEGAEAEWMARRIAVMDRQALRRRVLGRAS